MWDLSLRRTVATLRSGHAAVPRRGGSGTLSTRIVTGPTTAELTPVASSTRTVIACVPSVSRVVSTGTSIDAVSLQGTGTTNGILHAPWLSSIGRVSIRSPSTSTATRN